MMSYAPSLKVKAQAELELRQRYAARQERLRALSVSDFAARTEIEVPRPNGIDIASAPFVLWPQQADVLQRMTDERLLVILKARQLGISWLACLYALHLCTTRKGQPVLCLSRGQLEANELVHRISYLYHHHQDKAILPALTADNTADMSWSNGSTVISLAATRDAGRSLTAALAILDEWAFMRWPKETLAAVKPTIDAGGKLFIISSADAPGSDYHSFWQGASSGDNGYGAIFLPWYARPDRGTGWRDQKIVEANGDTSSVIREYPENADEAFIHAVGRVYEQVWSDGPADGNVTESAVYEPDAGPVFWGIDDGYAAGSAQSTKGIDKKTGHYVADSHPRVILFCQLRPTGQLIVFYELYACLKLSNEQIDDALGLAYPKPQIAAHGPGSAEIRGRLQHAQIVPNFADCRHVEEGIKALRGGLAKDVNGVRSVLVHPSCRHLRAEMASYRYGDDQAPVKQFDHGPDACRYIWWVIRKRYGK